MEKLELKEFCEDLIFLCDEGLLALRCDEADSTESIRQKFYNIARLVREKQGIDFKTGGK